MTIIILLITTLLITIFDASAQEPVIPKYKTVQVLATPAETNSKMNYLAFPSLLRINPDEILISFKRGYRHGGGKEAVLEMIQFNTENNQIISRQAIYDPGYIYQMGEWVKFPNDKIAIYTDTQREGIDGNNYRTGMRVIHLKKSGENFSATPAQLVPKVDGVEYGYPFDFIVKGNTTYMLVMNFGYNPGGRWSVDVIKSQNNGKSWTFVRNLTKEFGGHPINESAFIPWENGFIVTTRGYDGKERIYQTDREFHVLQKKNLTDAYSFMESIMGRPRLFSRNSQVYLLGRNYSKQGRPMELAMFRIDPETLQITKYVILDNAERANVTDGYYAFPYFQKRDEKIYFNVITYRASNNKYPNIIRFEYKWNEIR